MPPTSNGLVITAPDPGSGGNRASGLAATARGGHRGARAERRFRHQVGRSCRTIGAAAPVETHCDGRDLDKGRLLRENLALRRAPGPVSPEAAMAWTPAGGKAPRCGPGVSDRAARRAPRDRRCRAIWRPERRTKGLKASEATRARLTRERHYSRSMSKLHFKMWYAPGGGRHRPAGPASRQSVAPGPRSVARDGRTTLCRASRPPIRSVCPAAP